MIKLYISLNVISLFGIFLTFFGSLSYIIGIVIIAASNTFGLSYGLKDYCTCFQKHDTVTQGEEV